MIRLLPAVKLNQPPLRKFERNVACRRLARARIAAGARARWARVKGTAPKATKRGKRRLSAAGRAAIVAATKARWARVKGVAAKPKAAKKRRKVSAAVKARLAEIARARWAKAKAEGKKAL